MSISIIVALDSNRAIGKNNQLLCHIPGDLGRFKTLTTNHTIIMGRKTYESLPNGALPNRRNIVISKNLSSLPNCEIASDITQALNMAEEDQNELFIIGGGSIYAQTLDLADKLYLTEIHADFDDADTFFPPIKKEDWVETFREDHTPTEKCKYAFSFINLKRK